MQLTLQILFWSCFDAALMLGLAHLSARRNLNLNPLQFFNLNDKAKSKLSKWVPRYILGWSAVYNILLFYFIQPAEEGFLFGQGNILLFPFFLNPPNPSRDRAGLIHNA